MWSKHWCWRAIRRSPWRSAVRRRCSNRRCATTVSLDVSEFVIFGEKMSVSFLLCSIPTTTEKVTCARIIYGTELKTLYSVPCRNMQKLEINWPFGTDQKGFYYNFEFYNYLRGLETQKKKRARALSPFVLAQDMPSDAIHHIGWQQHLGPFCFEDECNALELHRKALKACGITHAGSLLFLMQAQDQLCTPAADGTGIKYFVHGVTE